MMSDVMMWPANLARLEVVNHFPCARGFEIEVDGLRFGVQVVSLGVEAPFAGSLPEDPRCPSLPEVAGVIQAMFSRLLQLELDAEGAWAVYREELAVTRAEVLPVWEELDGEVKEAFCAGLRRGVEPVPPEAECRV